MSQVPDHPIAAVTHVNPYPYYADLALRAPLAYDSQLGLWVAASAEAVTAVLKSPLCRVRPPAEPVPRPLLGSSAAEIFRRLVRMNDGPRHPELKQAAASLLEPLDESRATAASREWARRLAADIGPAATLRQITDFAFRLPVFVMGHLLGVPAEELPALARRTGDFVAAIAPGSPAAQVEAGKDAAEHLLALFRSLDPGSADDLIANRIGFLVQAHDATAGLIGNALLALAARPEIRRQASADPGLLHQVLLEVLRFDPSIQNTRRFLAEDGLVAGCSLHAGDAVLVLLAAANRDPAANPDPDRFDPFRADRRLFTFGLGAHACMGETLAVAIAQAGIESLESGLNLENLAGSFTYRPSVNARIPLFG